MTSQLSDWDVRPLGPLADDEGLILRVDTTPDGVRHAALVPRSIKGATPEQGAYLSAIQKTSAEMAELSERLDHLVPEARAEGLSWEAIGWVLGTTGSAVRKRWGAPSEPR